MTALVELIGAASAVGAIVGVVLNNYRLRGCFPIWMVTNALSAGIHAYAGIWSLVARDVVFLALAVHGWRQWGKEATSD